MLRQPAPFPVELELQRHVAAVVDAAAIAQRQQLARLLVGDRAPDVWVTFSRVRASSRACSSASRSAASSSASSVR